jgi:putative cardiolipin synthase
MSSAESTLAAGSHRVVRGVLAAWAICALALALAGCSSLPQEPPPSPTHAFTDTDDTALGRWAAKATSGSGSQSAVRLLGRGLDAFAARLALVHLAERGLDIQTYIWRSDTSGQMLAAALLAAADRGVRVRLLIDDMGIAADEKVLRTLDAHAGIEVRLFNPVATRTVRVLGALLTFDRSNRRMHNKTFTADGRATIVGGRNMGDEYFEARPDLDFDDLDVLALGQAARDVSHSFDQYWNDGAAFGIGRLGPYLHDASDLQASDAALRASTQSRAAADYARGLREADLALGLRSGVLPLTPARVQVLADGPDKLGVAAARPADFLLTRLMPQFLELRREVVFVSPYFVPSGGGMENLLRLRARGLRVVVITNSHSATDVPAVHAGYARYRKPLLDAGVELYEMKPTPRQRGPRGERPRQPAESVLRVGSRASLHAKALVFDCRQVFIGSMNIDPRSIRTNTEIGLLIDAPELGRAMCDGIARTLPAQAWQVRTAGVDPGDPLEWLGSEDGVPTVTRQEPGASGWRKLQLWLFSILPVEDLL